MTKKTAKKTKTTAAKTVKSTAQKAPAPAVPVEGNQYRYLQNGAEISQYLNELLCTSTPIVAPDNLVLEIKSRIRNVYCDGQLILRIQPVSGEILINRGAIERLPESVAGGWTDHKSRKTEATLKYRRCSVPVDQILNTLFSVLV